jgi:hypothetical protein
MNIPITKVRFYKETDGILAIFTDEKLHDRRGNWNTCYSHMDGHSMSERKYHYKLPKATKTEYQSLANELTAVGYNLKILNKT